MEEITFTYYLEHLAAARARFDLIFFILPVIPAMVFAHSLILMIMAGYISISVVTILASVGIFDLLLKK